MEDSSELSRKAELLESEKRTKKSAKQAYNDNLKNVIIVIGGIILAIYMLPMLKSEDGDVNELKAYEKLINSTTKNMSCSWMKRYLNSVPPGLFGSSGVWYLCRVEDLVFGAF